VWLHVFGYALIAIFIPILLLELNYTIGEVMIYYFLYNAFDVPLNFLAQWMIKRVGARMVITLGTFAVVLFFALLFTLGPNDWVLLIALAFVGALYDVFYWVGHIYFFMQSSKTRESASKDTSFLSIARELGGLLAPAFGAMILIFFNKKILIILSILILAISIIPLIKIKDVDDKPKKTLSFKTFFRSWSDLRDYFISSLYAVHSAAEWVIWPVFIYLLFETIESVAIIPIIISITTIIFTYFAGNIKKEHRSIAIILGGVLIAITWILRLLIQEPLYYYISIFLIGLFTIFITIPVDSNMYERGKKIDALTASTYCNFFPMASKTIFFGFLALLINVFHVSFLTAAGSMFFVVLIMLLIKEEKETVTKK
jgi:MFS family permease